MFEDLDAAFLRRNRRGMEAGAMCYMMSKQGYLNDRRRTLAPAPDVFHSPDKHAAAWAQTCLVPR